MSLSKKTEIVLVNPGGRARTYQNLVSKIAAVEPPVWAGLMASFLRTKGCDVRILDANAEGLSPEEAAQRVLALSPRLVALVVFGQNPNASTQVLPAASAIANAIKQLDRNLPVIMVGGHVAALPQRTLEEEAAVDFVGDGEGLFPMLDLAKALESNRPDFRKVRGLWFREAGKVVKTGSPRLVENLDEEIPGIAWDLLPMDRYRAHNWHCFGGIPRSPYASIYTTLGCPFHCEFCCIQAPFRSGEREMGFTLDRNSYRYWSPGLVIKEIELLSKKYGVSNLKIADEIFVLNFRHVESICDLIIERGIKLNIWAYARVDTLKRPGILERMKKAGVNWLAFGFEAAHERVLKDIRKGYDPQTLMEVVRSVQKAGINIIGNFIFGLPEDDHETMKATLDLARETKCEFANFHFAMAYPGSKLYDSALNARLPLPTSWNGYSQYAADALPLPTRHLSGVEVLEFRDRAFNEFFSDEAYLKMISERFGAATAEEIKAMTSMKLERTNVRRS